MTKSRPKSAFIKTEDTRKPDRHLDGSPIRKGYAAEAGQYDSHLKQFGSDLNSVNFGRPYEFKPKEGPGPGEFEVDSPLTRSRVRVV